MHEISLMKSLVTILDKQMQDPEIGNVKTVYVEAGELRYVVPEILISSFNSLPKNKKLKNAKINLKVLPIKVKCADCAKISKTKKYNFKCSFCESKNVDIVSGNEFKLKGVEW